MDKEELIQLLKEYKENRAKRKIKLKELQNARNALKYCDDIDTSVTATLGVNQDIQSKNKISNKVLDRIEINDKRRRDLEEKISKLEKEVRELTDKVDTVEDRLSALKYKEKEILTAYYVEGLTAEDIGNRIYWELFKQTRSERHIQRVIEIATEKMANL